ncbi:MAG: T9SS type A sorting domain-containing protein, partial [Flavobacteriales bacterium]|nr:T9SS type A sorting domain-containing protein [Flavobacteriales bacterium]
ANCLNTATVVVGGSSPPVVTVTGLNPSVCGGSDGSATSLVSGGSAPYTYLWSNSATTANLFSLSAGAYTITVTDFFGCMNSATVTLNSPGAPSVTVTSTNESCQGNDGTASVSATGGSLPYSYVWSDLSSQTDSVAVALASGTYFVTLTDNAGCITIGTAIVGASTSTLTVGLVKLDVSCNGGNDGVASATAFGGTTPYSYLWSTGSSSTGLTGIGVGTYSVTTTDASGCTATSSVTIDQPTTLTSSSSKTDASCSGNSDGAIDLSVSGGISPYTFLWSNSSTTEDLTGVAAGSYSVVITDANGCTASNLDSVQNISAGPNTSSIIGPIGVSEFQVANYSVGFVAGSSYNWVITGGNQSSGGQTNGITVQWGTAGSGQVAVVETDTTGCVGDTVVLSVTIQTVGIIDYPGSGGMKIYPNPFTHSTLVTFRNEAKEMYELFIFDLAGKKVRTQSNITGSNIEIAKEYLNPGVYFIELHGSARTLRGKIIVE